MTANAYTALMARSYHDIVPAQDQNPTPPTPARAAGVPLVRSILAVAGSLLLTFSAIMLAVRLLQADAWRFDRDATEAAIAIAFQRAAGADPYDAWTSEIASALGSQAGDRDPNFDAVAGWLAAAPDMVGREALLARSALKGYPAPRLNVTDAASAAQTAALYAQVLGLARQNGVEPPERVFLPEDLANHGAWTSPAAASLTEFGLQGGQAGPRPAARLRRDNGSDVVVYGALALIVAHACGRAGAAEGRAACENVAMGLDATPELAVALSLIDGALTGGLASHPDWTEDTRRAAGAYRIAAREGRLATSLAQPALLDARAALIPGGEERITSVLANALVQGPQAATVVDELNAAVAASVRPAAVSVLADRLGPLGAAMAEASPHTVQQIIGVAGNERDLMRLLVVAEVSGERWPALWALHGEGVRRLARREIRWDTTLVLAAAGLLLGVGLLAEAFRETAVARRRRRRP